MTLPAASDGVSMTKKANSLRGKPRGTDPRKDWNKVERAFPVVQQVCPTLMVPEPHRGARSEHSPRQGTYALSRRRLSCKFGRKAVKRPMAGR